MGEKMVKMRNPANDMVSTVSERAFEDIWKDKGYTKVEYQGEDAPTTETMATGSTTGETGEGTTGETNTGEGSTDQSDEESTRRRRR